MIILQNAFQLSAERFSHRNMGLVCVAVQRRSQIVWDILSLEQQPTLGWPGRHMIAKQSATQPPFFPESEFQHNQQFGTSASLPNPIPFPFTPGLPRKRSFLQNCGKLSFYLTPCSGPADALGQAASGGLPDAKSLTWTCVMLVNAGGAAGRTCQFRSFWIQELKSDIQERL